MENVAESSKGCFANGDDAIHICVRTLSSAFFIVMTLVYSIKRFPTLTVVCVYPTPSSTPDTVSGVNIMV
jgi:hypothetical protein